MGHRHHHHHQGAKFTGCAFLAMLGLFWPAALPISPQAQGFAVVSWLAFLAAVAVSWLAVRHHRRRVSRPVQVADDQLAIIRAAIADRDAP